MTANSLHAVVAADADVPGVLAAAVAAVPPIVLLAITHLTVLLTRTHHRPAPAAESSPEPADAGSTWPPPAGEPRDSIGKENPWPLPAPDHEARPGGEASAVEPGEAVRPVVSAEAVELTERADSSVGPEAAVDRRELAASLRDQGWSNKAIAQHVGVHASTVGRWLAEPTSTASNAVEEEL